MAGAVEEPRADIRRPPRNERSSEGGVMPLTVRCDNPELCPRPSRVPVEDAGFTTTAAPDTQSLPIHGGHCQVGRPVRGDAVNSACGQLTHASSETSGCSRERRDLGDDGVRHCRMKPWPKSLSMMVTNPFNVC